MSATKWRLVFFNRSNDGEVMALFVAICSQNGEQKSFVLSAFLKMVAFIGAGCRSDRSNRLLMVSNNMFLALF